MATKRITAYLTILFFSLLTLPSLYTEAAKKNYTFLQGINIQYPDTQTSQVNVVISADESFDYKRFKLDADKKTNKPLRYVIDAYNARPKFYIDDNYQRIFDNDAIIKLIRVGKNHKDYTRIVFDLKQPVNVQVSEQVSRSGGHVFVISFSPVNQQIILDNKYNEQEEEELATLVTPEGTQLVSSARANNIIQGTQQQQQQQPKTIQTKTPSNTKFQVASTDNSKKDTLTIIVDPGHGGSDPGAISPDGRIQEKSITYSVSRKLTRFLNRDPKFNAHLTRTSDIQASLGKRRKISHEKAADIFISIHADSFPGSSDINGASVFVLADKSASNQLARLIAKKENEVDEKYNLQGIDAVTNKDTQFILRDLQRKSIDNASEKLAIETLKEIAKVKSLFSPLPRKGPFAVLKSSYVPSILIELGYITNPTEAKALINEHEQNKLANAIYLGIKNYADKNLLITPIRASKAKKAIIKSNNNTAQTKAKNTIQEIRETRQLIEPNKTNKKTIIYRVLLADTYQSIAQKFNTTEEKIKEMNPKYRDLIFSGDQLILPAPSSP